MKIRSKIILPFRLPVKDNLAMGSQYAYGKVYTKFSTFTYDYDGFLANINNNRTILDISYFSENGLEKESSDTIQRVFYRLILRHINKIIHSFKINYHIDYLYEITIRDLPKFLECYIDDEKYYYQTTPEIKDLEDLINNVEEFAIIGSTITNMSIFPNIYLVDSLYTAAKSSYVKENFAICILELQTSFEIFIRNTILLILKINNATEEEIRKKEQLPFRNTIEQFLSKVLDENLSFSDNPIIKKWNNELYKIRNKIIHSGTSTVSEKVARDAIDSYIKVRNYLSDLLLERGFLKDNGNVDLKKFDDKDIEIPDMSEFIDILHEHNLIDKVMPIKIIKPKNNY